MSGKSQQRRRRLSGSTKLARLRISRDLRQDELAEMTGIRLRTLQRLEAGEMPNPPLRYLVNCAIALDVELEDVLEEDWQTWMLFDRRAPDPRRK